MQIEIQMSKKRFLYILCFVYLLYDTIDDIKDFPNICYFF